MQYIHIEVLYCICNENLLNKYVLFYSIQSHKKSNILKAILPSPPVVVVLGSGASVVVGVSKTDERKFSYYFQF